MTTDTLLIPQHLTPAETALIAEWSRRRDRKKTAGSFLRYMRKRAPWMVIEEFHILIAEAFQRLHDGTTTRLMIFAPPRGGKSLMTSVLLPEWWMGNNPVDQILHTSYATTLVEGFGRQIRNTIAADDAFRDTFPDCALSKDSKSATKWVTTAGGVYHAAGVGTGIAGKGFHLGIIDDPVSENDAFSRAIRKGVNAWFGPGFYTRRMPERNAIAITQTRWAVDDLSGFLLANAATAEGTDQWEVLRIPGIIDQKTADELNRIANTPEYEEFLTDGPRHYVPGDSFSPRRWPLATLKQSMAMMSKKDRASLIQQSPTEEEGSLILSKYWRPWKKDRKLPNFDYILQSYDTAFEPEEANDYSVCTTWGFFRRDSDAKMCAMVLGRYRDKPDFPTLREKAYELYKEWPVDRVIIEKKASGHSLIQELRRKNVPITPMPAKGSKESRASAVLVLFEQGCVYYPEGREWAEELIEECATFPHGKHDDQVDTVVNALAFARKMFLIEVPSDPEDEDDKLQNANTPVRSYAHLHGAYARPS